MNATVAVVIVAVIASAGPAASCVRDSDCSPGRQCLSAPGAASGVCVDGELKGVLEEDSDKAEEELLQAVKNPCQFDDQCHPGEYCFRLPGETYGICIRK